MNNNADTKVAQLRAAANHHRLRVGPANGGGITEEVVQRVSDQEPDVAAKLEGMLMLCQSVYNMRGDFVPQGVPLALLLGFIRVCEAPKHAQDVAFQIMRGEP